MSKDQIILVITLGMTITLFLWGRWRHDIVAACSLFACVLFDLIPASEAFSGFGHPAVITVASILILSYGLETTGAVDAMARRLLPARAGPVVTVLALTGVGALLSAFMNNVGALALLMPVAIQLATRKNMPPGKILMPLAFGTILGGMTTLIGTPPNLIVSGFRQRQGADSFAMFDFTPVGLVIALSGIIFLALLGWRLVPTRKRSDPAGFDTGAYFTELRLAEGSKLIGLSLRQVESMLESADAQIIGLVRKGLQLHAPSPRHKLRADDILIIEAEPDALTELLSSSGLKLEEAIVAKVSKETSEKNDADVGNQTDADDPVIRELAITVRSQALGFSASDLQMRTRYGLDLLAISRHGARSTKRLRSTLFQAGDVLLIQGSQESIALFANEYSSLPLAPRPIRIPDKRRAVAASLIMLLAIAGAAFGLLPAAISFSSGVLAFMLLRIIPLRKLYEAIDWPVIVLLAALMPVAGAIATTGTADLLARAMLQNMAQGNAVIALALVLIITMTLSDFMNNAATAAVMCPIAISLARQLWVSPDAFLMAVAIGASCAFLTPIGHQNNTLILGPGGFRFGDYWKIGLPLEILVIAVGLPMLLWMWPL